MKPRRRTPPTRPAAEGDKDPRAIGLDNQRRLLRRMGAEEERPPDDVAATEDDPAEATEHASDGDEPLPAQPDEAAPAARPPVITAGRPSLPADVPDPTGAEFEAFQQRATQMESIATFAQRHGVDFRLQAALRSRMTIAAARNQVLEARATADEATPTFAYATYPSATASSAADGWDRAIARAAERNGLKQTGSSR